MKTPEKNKVPERQGDRRPVRRKKVLLFYNPRSGDGMFKNNLDKII